MHRLQDRLRLWRWFIDRRFGFDQPNLIANPCRIFIAFFVNCSPKFATQFDQAKLLLDGVRGTFGDLSAVLRFAVDVFK